MPVDTRPFVAPLMALADRYECFLFDLDGVLYRADRAVPKAAPAVARLRASGKRVVFMTNNSSRTPERVAERLRRLGIEAQASDVVTSAMATADLLASRSGSVFVVGEEGIRTALADAGITILDGDPPTADHVVVGWDRHADYSKLRTASLLVQRGARLVATNADPSYPAPDGLWPGAGALLSVVTVTTGAEPEIVGKPHAQVFRTALKRAGGGKPLVIGDRLDTDVAGAAALGWDSLLVLTGITRRTDIERTPVDPTYVGDDLSALFDG